MLIDPLPAATNYGYWNETAEFVDTEDGSPIDFRPCPEIRMEVIDPYTNAVVLLLTRTGGQITTPVEGIIEWLVGSHVMRSLFVGTYEVRMNVQIDSDPDSELAIMRSSVTIIS